MEEEDDRGREEEKKEEEEEVASKPIRITIWRNRDFFYFMYTGILPACMSANHMCAVSSEARKS